MPRSPSLISRPLVSSALLAGALSLLACSPEAPKAAAAPPPPLTVTVTPALRKDVPLYQEAVGSMLGYVDAEIRARVKGFLEAQKYKDGATVTQGQLLFTIEQSEYQSAVSSAKAALARAQTAQLHNKAQLDRKQALSKSKVVSEQELEDAQASARDADNQVEAAQAALHQAQLNLSYTQVRSPITGVAGLASVRVGNLVGQDGATLLTTVSQVDPIRVNFPMSEIDYVKASEQLKGLDKRDLAWARKQFAALDAGGTGDGAGLELLLVDGKTYGHRGVVVSVNRQIDPGTGTIQLQALFPNPDGLLRPGQYARVRLRQTEGGANALVVPDASVIQMQGTYSVAVVGADDKIQLKRIEVGPSAGPLRIVTSGINDGDRVVVDGVQKVSDGMKVIPTPAAPKTASKG